MKMVAVMSKQVKDLTGLYIDLRKKDFAVDNVGSDQAGTYVYLDGNEQKDPTPYVEEWAGKAARAVTKAEVRKRKDELEKIGPRKPLPSQTIETMLSGSPASPESKKSVEGTTVEASILSSPQGTQEEKPGLLKRILRKLFT